MEGAKAGCFNYLPSLFFQDLIFLGYRRGREGATVWTKIWTPVSEYLLVLEKKRAKERMARKPQE